MDLRRLYRCAAAFILSAAIALGFSACNAPRTVQRAQTDINTVDGLKEYLVGKTVGFKTGTLFDQLAPEWFPDSQFAQYMNDSDLRNALENGKIDAWLTDKPVAAEIDKTTTMLKMSEAILMPDAYGMILNKEDIKLLSEFNDALRKMKEDGTYDRILDMWLNTDERTMPDVTLTGENGTLIIATNSGAVPFTYIQDDVSVGIDFDIIARFCEMYGYDYEVQIMDFSGIIPSVVSGRCDIGADCISITAERAEQVNFTDSYYTAGSVALLRTEAFGENAMTAADYNVEGMRIGVDTGSFSMSVAEDYYTNAQIEYYNNATDGFYAVEQGVLDAFVGGTAILSYALPKLSGVKIITDPSMGSSKIAAAMNKENTALKAKIDEALTVMLNDGTIDEMYKRWVVDGKTEMPEIASPQNPSQTLRIGTCAVIEPFSFITNGELTGMEVEMARRVAAHLGMGITFETFDFSSIVEAIQSNRIDAAFTNLNITEAREKAVSFSIPYMNEGVSVLVADQSAVSADKSSLGAFIDSLSKSFERTFITENRWQLIVQGVLTTLVISAFSGVFGAVLGFAFCLLRRSKYRALSVPMGVFTRIVQGTPMVVILMILYYIVFGNMNAVVIAIIGFSINFGVYVSEMMRAGIDAVDKGQAEAASALGFTRRQTFLRIVFPQASVHFLPILKGEFISMVKMTSVVGYIAIQDLTKMSDIIRSRTYEAFFPLIATAVIYIIISWLLTLVISAIEIKTEPKHRKRIVKGVKVK